jgi:hypothetical protein
MLTLDDYRTYKYKVKEKDVGIASAHVFPNYHEKRTQTSCRSVAAVFAINIASAALGMTGTLSYPSREAALIFC